jgi:glycerol-3-phosphate acyltransferase PlsY
VKQIIILSIAAYLAGSINFAILLFILFGKEDPRRKFSGNAGTTNIYRQAGIFWAILVLILDIGRAVGVAFLSLYILKSEYMPVTGFFLVLGNKYPCFHQFRGGRGVANYLGFTLVLTPLWSGIAAGTWVIVYSIVRIPFIASFFMISVLAAGTIIINEYNPIASAGTLATVLFILYNHKSNIVEYIKRRQKEL